jgi:hypothetical protein
MRLRLWDKKWSTLTSARWASRIDEKVRARQFQLIGKVPTLVPVDTMARTSAI